MIDRKSTRLNSSHVALSRLPSFFLMIRRPPTSTLFPSAPLFRSITAVGKDMKRDAQYFRLACRIIAELGDDRSEEHTSELQSRGLISSAVFFFNDPATTDIYTLSLRAPLPIYPRRRQGHEARRAIFPSRLPHHRRARR